MLLSRFVRVKQKILRGNRSLWKTLARLRNTTRSHGGKKKKQQSVRGNVEVEIHHAVYQ